METPASYKRVMRSYGDSTATTSFCHWALPVLLGHHLDIAALPGSPGVTGHRTGVKRGQGCVSRSRSAASMSGQCMRRVQCMRVQSLLLLVMTITMQVVNVGELIFFLIRGVRYGFKIGLIDSILKNSGLYQIRF